MPRRSLNRRNVDVNRVNIQRQLQVILERMPMVNLIAYNRRLVVKLSPLRKQPKRLVVRFKRSNLIDANVRMIGNRSATNKERRLTVQLSRTNEPSRQLLVRLVRENFTCTNERLPARLERVQENVPDDGVVALNVGNDETNTPRINFPNDRYLIDPHLSQERPTPRRRHAKVPRVRTYRSAITLGNRVGAAENEIGIFYAGTFRVFCKYCGAKYFERERVNRQGVNLSCCKNGDIRLEALGECPEVLLKYLTDISPMASNFREKIRSINSNFGMATFKARIPEGVNQVGDHGMWCFIISGQVYHHCQAIPSFRVDQNLLNAQYYFVDVDEAVKRRIEFLGDRVPRLTLENIERMLREVNPLIQGYMTAGVVIRELIDQYGDRSLKNITVGFRDDINRQRRNFALPESRSEIAAVFEGDPPFEVDLIVYSHNRSEGKNGRHELKNLNPLSDPMTYPLLFPHGERGYDFRNLRHERNNKVVTFREFYRYRIHCRDGFSILHNGGKLFQQYVVDAWVKVECNYLWYLRNNIIQQRLANYDKILQIVERRAVEERCRVGTVNILPASFQGGNRHRKRNYLDAMAVIARHGKPDLFITFTCNPMWPEITTNLEHQQKYQNRMDLICRVFHVKLLEFIDDIVKKQLYGTVLNYFYVVEFQKRGLPHAHILVTFYPEDKLSDVDKVDQIVCAEIPDMATEPKLFAIVAENYIHNVCAPDNMEARCLREGRCSKGFPKRYQDVTELNYQLTTTRDGRPEYRRRNDGRTVFINGHRYTNRDVVPYNRYAALKYRCHINFECVGSLASVKYLYKYVTKGVDMCSIERNEVNGEVIHWDEIKNYLNCRYVSSMEATWRLFEFLISDWSHCVVRLPIHLENRQQVAFHEEEDGDEILARADRATKLTAYFQLNRDDPDARLIKYIQIPEHYTWQNITQEWRRRVKIIKVIGNIVEVTSTNSELFYLRMLLQHVRGATSFQNLRTLPNGMICETYRETCDGLHLLENADMYRDVMREAINATFPSRLRRLYTLLILLSIDVGDNVLAAVVSLWNDFKDPHMIRDFRNRGITRPNAIRLALDEIESTLRRNHYDTTLHTIGLIDNEQLPGGTDNNQQPPNNLTNIDEVDNEAERQCLEVAGQTYRVDALTADQRQVYNYVLFTVISSQNLLEDHDVLDHFELGNFVENRAIYGNNDPTIFFVDGPAGTGKTFLYNVIIYKIAQYNHKRRYNHEIRLKILTVAYTGIAASLLYQGQTVHRAFKLPLQLDKNARAGWTYEHRRSRELAAVNLILWDEVSMTPRYALEAVDRYLRDITHHDAMPFGKKVMLFGGDFRQTLPIIQRGSRCIILASSVKASRLWQHVDKLFNLTTNLRAELSTTPAEASSYASWILNMGEDKLPHVRVTAINAPIDLVRIPINTIATSRIHLIEWVYGRVQVRAELNERVILCPTNAVVQEINQEVLERLPGQQTTYYSVDSLIRSEEDEFIVPQDLLHSIVASNLPPHELNLKVGAVVILLRNLNTAAGLCNGCRFIVCLLLESMIELEAITGAHMGQRFFLPKMILRCKVPELPNPIRRVQFPIRLAFAMTINKSQGQTFSRLGLHMPAPCFSHGQLYVAFSRVGNFNNVKVCIVNSPIQGCFAYRDGTILTRNVVYTEVLGATLLSIDNTAPMRFRTNWRQSGRNKSTSIRNVDNDNTAQQLDDGMDKVLIELDVHALTKAYLRSNIPHPAKAHQDVEVPLFNTQQLKERESTSDRAGTSGGGNIQLYHYEVHRRFHQQSDDSDSD